MATSPTARRATRSRSLRDGANATTESLILFRVAAGAFTELVSNPSWRWVPEFISLANGDLNGDGDGEVVMLRDPVNPSTSLHMVNPAGAAMNSFDQATGAGAAAFKIVRTGDVDGDGRAEIVILRDDRYRLYTEPNVDSRAVETTGAFYATGGVSNLPFLAVANVDGAGILDVPTLSVTPASLSFSLDFDATSPIKPLSITNSGTASSFPWQAQVIEGSDWLLIDASQGTTPGQVNVSVKTTIMPGTYTGQIRISTTDVGVRNNPVEIPVFYTLVPPDHRRYPGHRVAGRERQRPARCGRNRGARRANRADDTGVNHFRAHRRRWTISIP